MTVFEDISAIKKWIEEKYEEKKNDSYFRSSPRRPSSASYTYINLREVGKKYTYPTLLFDYIIQ